MHRAKQTYCKNNLLGKKFLELFSLASLPLLFFGYFNILLLWANRSVFYHPIFLARYFQKWIDGYTGDCLGATQQVCKAVFYLSFLVLWKFI
ncbi:adenosylcobinamide-GDP ribazoletransferase [Flavobacterium procerum]|uniref:adenosylcobinamide-GDP ribazoletransferase n=1 Tax=Flavobacterium procerum TaxID=1455569 RepID=UPI0035ECDDB4